MYLPNGAVNTTMTIILNRTKRDPYHKHCKQTSHSNKRSLNQTQFQMLRVTPAQQAPNPIIVGATISITTKQSRPIISRHITCFNILTLLIF
jgi:hypothetical protein